MTRDQMHQEHERLKRVLEEHETRAAASAIPQNRDGLKQRIAALAEKLEAAQV
ncbi:MAG TPA: hypothetical protein VGC56_13200 [Allosphingosinicella sp.]